MKQLTSMNAQFFYADAAHQPRAVPGQLIRKDEQATGKRMGMIRTCSAIGRAQDSMLLHRGRGA